MLTRWADNSRLPPLMSVFCRIRSVTWSTKTLCCASSKRCFIRSKPSAKHQLISVCWNHSDLKSLRGLVARQDGRLIIKPDDSLHSACPTTQVKKLSGLVLSHIFPTDQASAQPSNGVWLNAILWSHMWVVTYLLLQVEGLLNSGQWNKTTTLR